MSRKNEVSLMTGKTLGFDALDENGNLKGSYSFRCMNCGNTGKFVPTLDWKHFCCVTCTCIVADIDPQAQADMSQARWKI